MKQYFFILLLVMMSLSANTSLAADSTTAIVKEHLVEQANGVVISDKEKTTEMMIPSGPTLGAIKNAFNESVKTLVSKMGLVNSAKQEVIDERQSNVVAGKVIHELTGNTGALTKIGIGVKSVSSSINSVGTGLFLLIFITSAILLVVIIITRRRKEKPEEDRNKCVLQAVADLTKTVNRRADKLEQKIEEVPAKVKMVDQIVITDLEIGKRMVTFTPKIKDNYHLSLRIPIGNVAQVSDPSKITRTPTNDRGRLVDTTIAAFRLIDANANDGRTALTRALIRLAIKEGEIRVTEII